MWMPRECLALTPDVCSLLWYWFMALTFEYALLYAPTVSYCLDISSNTECTIIRISRIIPCLWSWYFALSFQKSIEAPNFIHSIWFSSCLKPMVLVLWHLSSILRLIFLLKVFEVDWGLQLWPLSRWFHSRVRFMASISYHWVSEFRDVHMQLGSSWSVSSKTTTL